MPVVNKHGLPDTIHRAVLKQNAAYNPGNVDTSVSQLLSPPRIAILRRKHASEMVKDVVDDFWALLGSAVHHIVELGATDNMVCEERLFMSIDGWNISGAIDVQEIDGKYIDIVDYKTTTVYAVQDGGKIEWEHQLNLYAMLIEANKPGMIVRSLTICAMMRDWSGSNASRDALYPQAPMKMIQLPLWPAEQRLAFARSRIAAHRHARFALAMGDDLPECTPQERWTKNNRWAVMKEGGKRAVKTFSNEADAYDFRLEAGDNHYVEARPGKSTRCGFCGVSDFCTQYARMKDATDE